MKLKNLEIIEQDDNGLQLEGANATISFSNISFIIKMLSKMYSDPIGSMVRELASNAVDAHRAEGIEKPILVGAELTDEGRFFFVQDFGCGMSHEFMLERYTAYGDSNKRDSNALIGGFGIGSKSPFSWDSCESFYIETNSDGQTTRKYIYYKTNDLPRLDLIDSYESSEKGTLVKVPISYGDENKFISAAKIQLMYFDDVYYLSKGAGYWDFLNHFKIADRKLFVYNSKASEVDSQVHICLDKVYYPIDFKRLNPKYKDLPNIPVGIKFNTGELVPTPSREAIEYNDEIVALLERKIDNIITFLYKNRVEEEVTQFEITKSSKKQDATEATIKLSDDVYFSVMYRLNNDALFKRIKRKPSLIKGTSITHTNKFCERVIEWLIRDVTHNFYTIPSRKSYRYDSGNDSKYNILEGRPRYVVQHVNVSKLLHKYLNYIAKDHTSNIYTIRKITVSAVYKQFFLKQNGGLKKAKELYEYLTKKIENIKFFTEESIPESFYQKIEESKKARTGTVNNTISGYNITLEEVIARIKTQKKKVIWCTKEQNDAYEFLVKLKINQLLPKYLEVIKIHKYMIDTCIEEENFIPVADYFTKHRNFRLLATAAYLRTRKWHPVIYSESGRQVLYSIYKIKEEAKFIHSFFIDKAKQHYHAKKMIDNMELSFAEDIIKVADQMNLYFTPVKLAIDKIDRELGDTDLTLINHNALNYQQKEFSLLFKKLNLNLLPTITNNAVKAKQLNLF
jgi:hypothetical protein